MRFWISTIALVGLAVVILLAMRRGWLGRSGRTAAVVGPLPEAPLSLGTARTAPFDATYVGSTTAGEWLERIAGQGLGSRAAGSIQLFETGLQVVRQGTDDVYIPADRIAAVRFDRGHAGKVASSRRLVVVTWRLEIAVESGFLLRNDEQAHELVTALENVIGHNQHNQQKEAG